MAQANKRRLAELLLEQRLGAEPSHWTEGPTRMAQALAGPRINLVPMPLPAEAPTSGAADSPDANKRLMRIARSLQEQDSSAPVMNKGQFTAKALMGGLGGLVEGLAEGREAAQERAAGEWTAKMAETLMPQSAPGMIEPDPPSLKWSDLKYVIWHQEDRYAEEALQA